MDTMKGWISILRKRINHNNLLPWFTQDHGTLPASYLASCEKFFKDIEQREGIKFAGRFKPEATSSKQELTSKQDYDNRIIKEKL